MFPLVLAVAAPADADCFYEMYPGGYYNALEPVLLGPIPPDGGFLFDTFGFEGYGEPGLHRYGDPTPLSSTTSRVRLDPPGDDLVWLFPDDLLEPGASYEATFGNDTSVVLEVSPDPAVPAPPLELEAVDVGGWGPRPHTDCTGNGASRDLTLSVRSDPDATDIALLYGADEPGAPVGDRPIDWLVVRGSEIRTVEYREERLPRCFAVRYVGAAGDLGPMSDAVCRSSLSCGCSAATAPGAASPLLLLAVAGVAGRRRLTRGGYPP